MLQLQGDDPADVCGLGHASASDLPLGSRARKLLLDATARSSRGPRPPRRGYKGSFLFKLSWPGWTHGFPVVESYSITRAERNISEALFPAHGQSDVKHQPASDHKRTDDPIRYRGWQFSPATHPNGLVRKCGRASVAVPGPSVV